MPVVGATRATRILQENIKSLLNTYKSEKKNPLLLVDYPRVPVQRICRTINYLVAGIYYPYYYDGRHRSQNAAPRMAACKHRILHNLHQSFSITASLPNALLNVCAQSETVSDICRRPCPAHTVFSFTGAVARPDDWRACSTRRASFLRLLISL